MPTASPSSEIIKGVTVGDSLDKVVAQFIDNGYDMAYKELLGDYRLLYGEIIHRAAFPAPFSTFRL